MGDLVTEQTLNTENIVQTDNLTAEKLVVSDKVYVVGDLHLSDVFEGKHKDYWGNCLNVMEDLCKRVEEAQPEVVVLLGDVIGCNETNIKSRENLSKVFQYFMRIKQVCRIVGVRGNHDMAGYPDFDILCDLGLVERYKYIDFVHDGKLEVRFHLVDYGQERADLILPTPNTEASYTINSIPTNESVASSTTNSNTYHIPETVSNVVFGHQDYMIDGVTTWYPKTNKAVELVTLQNFADVDFVVSGHIHIPSSEIVSITTSKGKEQSLFYVGCPTRPTRQQGNYELCWYMAFDYNTDKQEVDFDMIPVELTPLANLFYEDETIIKEKTQEELDEELRKQNLKSVLNDVMEYRLLQGDYIAQIDKIPDATQEAKDMAKNYITMVQNGERTA